MKPLLATARLQFHKNFTLHQAREVVPYLAALGITHLYASPLLKARPGSTHGYDIVDHNDINPELGGEPALRELVATLRAHGMGLILDIVPNHMGVGGADNAWWLDVLEWGRASPYATYFDIDWDPPNPALRNRLLAPFLGAPYGTCLANGDIALRFDPTDGRFFAAYAEHRFPINPRDYPAILADHPSLAPIAARFAALGPAGGSTREAGLGAAGTLSADLGTDPGLPAITAALAADHASQTGSASDQATAAATVQATITNALTAKTGVSIDTEMSSMIALQNAYGANARLISAVQAMFSAILQATS
jgi:(1->4)-alpha-D-glucan 1-alpha-D-glucosylmutase